MGLFSRVKKIWSQDMAIDLGTANTLVVVKGQGVVPVSYTHLTLPTKALV